MNCADHVVNMTWRIAKCCAAALFLGAPPRPTPWGGGNTLGLPMGAFRLRTRLKTKIAFLIEIHGFFAV